MSLRDDDVDPANDAGARAALVIAVDTYLDEGLSGLRSPAADATTFGEVLGDPELGGFDVTSLVNGNAHQVRLAVVEFLSECRPEDVALVYLSCHGLVDVRRRLYFAATDTLKDRLSATGVEAHWLLDQLEECRARRQVVVLDCCFSGAFARGSKGPTDLGLGERLLGQGRGRVVLTASRGTEYSFEGSPIPGSAVPGSVFTNALVSGIRSGAADTDGDGYISVDDAYTYAFDEMRVSGAEQTPQRWLYGAEGSILLARRPTAAGAPLGQRSRPAVPAEDRGFVTTRADRGSSPLALLGRHRALAAAVSGAAGVVTVGLLVQNLHHVESGGGENGAVAVTPRSGTWRLDGPWSLFIDAGTRADPTGACLVTLKDTATGKVTEYPRPGHEPEQDRSYWQVAQPGTYRWSVNDGECTAVKHRRPVETTESPFIPELGHGDSEAFVAQGKVTIEVTDFQGSSTCALRLYNLSTGLELSSVDATEDDNPVDLDPLSARTVYVRDPPCEIRITP